MASDKTATFGIRIKSESDTDKTAASVEGLRQSILASQEAVKNYGSSLRNLRGNSEAVKTAKDKLKAAQDAERAVISKATLALGKHGETVRTTKADVSSFLGKLTPVIDVFGLIRSGANTVNEAFYKLASSIFDASVSLVKWLFVSADELRNQKLLRDGVDASAISVKNAGDQIDVLADKVPQSRAELNKLFVDVRQSFDRTRVTGQGIVDVFNALAQESSAAGPKAASALQGILERGKELGRLSLNPLELQGTGLTFADVVTNLAKEAGVSIKSAQAMLYTGRANLSQGAAAIRKAVETRFGEVNARKLLSLDVLAVKFKDTLSNLTRDVRLEPILRGFKSLSDLFDETTVTGKTVKKLLSDTADVLGKGFLSAVPYVKLAFTELLRGVTNLQIAYYETQNAGKSLFSGEFLKNLGLSTEAITLVKGALTGVGLIVGALAAVAAAGFIAITATVVGVGIVINKVYEDVMQFYHDATTIDWAYLGTAIVEGIKSGFTSAKDGLIGAVTGTVNAVKNTFKDALMIQSPSKVFASYGKNTALGYSQGLESETASVQRSVDSLVPAPPQMPRSAGGSTGAAANGGASGAVSIIVNAEFPNAKDGAGVTAALTSNDFRARFLSMITAEMRAAAVPTQTAPGAVT